MTGEMRVRNVRHLRNALVAVLGAAIVGPGGIGLLEIGDEVRDRGSGQRAPQPIAVGLGHRVRHEAAVADTGDHHAVLVERRLLRDPVEQRADVLHRILPLGPVVHTPERLAEAIAAADVRIQNRDPELVEEIVAAALVARALARRRSGGPPVDVDNHGSRAGEPRGRPVEHAGDHQAIEALPRDDFRGREPLRVEAAGLAGGPPAHGAGAGVHRVHVAIGIDRHERERDLRATPLRGADQRPDRNLRGPPQRERGRVAKLETARGRAVVHERERRPVGGKREALQRVLLAGHQLPGAGRDVAAPDTHRLGPAVAEGVHEPAVRGVPRPRARWRLPLRE